MTLTVLLEKVLELTNIPPSRRKDLQTSLRYLAKALGKASPEQCFEEDFFLPESLWKDRLNIYLGSLSPSPSPHTVRNTRNNLSFLFRKAQELQILQPLNGLPTSSTPVRILEHEAAQNSPYKAHYPRELYGLTPEQWPPAIRTGWQQYLILRRNRLRPTSLTTYQQALERYIGFLINIDQSNPQTWPDLFSTAALDRFITWHAARLNRPVSHCGIMVATVITLIAKHQEHPAYARVADFRRTLPPPEPVHDKRYHWFTLREIEQVALGLLDDSRRATAGGTKLQTALKNGRALMLRILVRIPLRQRNIREMQLHRNLYMLHGNWYLTFKGTELKVHARQNGKINTIHHNLSQSFPDILPHLEEFLTFYRPHLKNAQHDQHVFLTQHGVPYQYRSLEAVLKRDFLQRTSKRFYPHLIRTIWATEFIQRTGDFTTAAFMLNDRVETVLARYQEINEAVHAQRASQFIQTILPSHPTSE